MPDVVGMQAGSVNVNTTGGTALCFTDVEGTPLLVQAYPEARVEEASEVMDNSGTVAPDELLLVALVRVI
jgi:hypothetical protein